MRLIAWLLRAFIFFTLFAFALNNQQVVTVHWFFGVHWNARLVIVVLAAFAAGCALGALAMVPNWWRQRQLVKRLQTAELPGVESRQESRPESQHDSRSPVAASTPQAPAVPPPPDMVAPAAGPPRLGL
jgi:lipopolysaccharide assembly protein A